MPRERSFDTEEVLQNVMHLFWRKGYDNTSLVDLETISGLKRPSLYNAFENKEELFKRALQTYLDFIETQMNAALIDGTIESIKNMFIPFTSENFPPNLSMNFGCLMVNTSIESINHNDSIKAFVIKYENLIYNNLLRILKKAKNSGDIKQELDPEELAGFLLTYLFGILLRVRYYNSVPALKRPALAVINVIDSWIVNNSN